MTLYDTIGKSYNQTRRADPRIVSRLIDLLSIAPNSVIADIGAGTGNYSLELVRAGVRCIAIEPSAEMSRQAQTHQAIEWISCRAEAIPLPDRSVSASISILSYHHFQDRSAALKEIVRITDNGPLIFFTFCPKRLSGFWLYRYFPTMLSDARTSFENAETTAEQMENWSGRNATLHWFALPHDLIDCFAAAAWSRPELYLDPQLRQGISSFNKVPQRELEMGLERLSCDLQDGTWDRTWGYLRSQQHLDVGYVFIRLEAT